MAQYNLHIDRIITSQELFSSYTIIITATTRKGLYFYI